MDFGPEMSLFAMFLGVVIGLAIGFALGRGGGGRGGASLRQRAEAHDALKRDVHQHMHETAQLMDKLAGDYRKVYAHLADGAQRMGVSDVPRMPEALTHDGGNRRDDDDDDTRRRDIPTGVP